MEEFLQMDWSWKNIRTEQEYMKHFDFNFSDNEEDVFYNHLNEIDVVHLLDETNEQKDDLSEDEIIIDPRNNNIIKNLIIDWSESLNNIEFFNKFPKKSSISLMEQCTCIRALSKITSDKKVELTDKDKKDLEIYNTIENLSSRKKEKEDFKAFVKNYMLTNCSKRLIYVHPIFEEFVLKNWRSALNSIKIKETNFLFRLQTLLPLDYATDLQLNIKMEMIKLVKQCGTIPRIFLSFSSPFINNVRKNCDKMMKYYQYSDDDVEDNNIQEELALENNIDYIITSGSLCKLMDITNTNDSWNIRMSIKEINGVIDNKYFERTTIIIHKPLPPNYLNGMEKNKKAHKYALKAYISDPLHKASWSLDENKSVGDCGNIIKKKVKHKTENKKENDLLTNELNVQVNNNDKELNVNNEYNNDDLSNNSQTILTSNQEEKFEKEDFSETEEETSQKTLANDDEFDISKDNVNNKNVPSTTTISNQLQMPFEFEKEHEPILYEIEDFIENVQNKLMITNNCKITNNVIKKRNKNYTYRVWKMFNENNNSLKENSCVNILIRTKQDGRDKSQDDCFNFINLSTKMEYQSEFGAEQMEKSELIKEWCRQYFRPESLTKRVRIDAPTSIIMSQEILNLENIEKQLYNLYEIKPEILLNTLFGRFQIIKNYPPGEYLLRKNNDNCNIMVYAECDERGPNVIDLNDYFNNICFEQKTLDETKLNPIDDMVVTTLHRQASIMPCAFGYWCSKQNIIFDDKEKFRIKQRKIQNKKIILKTTNANLNKNKFNKKREQRKRKLLNQQKLQSNTSKQSEPFECYNIVKRPSIKCEKQLNDTINPYDFFNESGQVQLANNSNNSTFIPKNDIPNQSITSDPKIIPSIENISSDFDVTFNESGNRIITPKMVNTKSRLRTRRRKCNNIPSGIEDNKKEADIEVNIAKKERIIEHQKSSIKVDLKNNQNKNLKNKKVSAINKIRKSLRLPKMKKYF